MPDDLGELLDAAILAADAQRQVKLAKHNDFAKGVSIFNESLESALAKVEKRFIFDDGPATLFKKELSDFVLQVGENDDYCWKLVFKTDWVDCRLIVETLAPDGHRRQQPYELKDLAGNVNRIIADFVARARSAI